MELQKEMYDWKIKNFGQSVNGGMDMLLGVIEEIGELSHSVLKKYQGIRTDGSDFYIKDSIGDIFIFIMQYLSENSIEYDEMHKYYFDLDMKFESVEKYIFGLYSIISEIIRNDAEYEMFYNGLPEFGIKTIINEQEILNYINLAVRQLCLISASLGWNFYSILNDVWKEVKMRDWKTYKLNGVNQ